MHVWGHLISTAMKHGEVPFCHHGSWQDRSARTPQAISIGYAVQICSDVIGQMAPLEEVGKCSPDHTLDCRGGVVARLSA